MNTHAAVCVYASCALLPIWSCLSTLPVFLFPLFLPSVKCVSAVRTLSYCVHGLFVSFFDSELLPISYFRFFTTLHTCSPPSPPSPFPPKTLCSDSWQACFWSTQKPITHPKCVFCGSASSLSLSTTQSPFIRPADIQLLSRTHQDFIGGRYLVRALCNQDEPPGWFNLGQHLLKVVSRLPKKRMKMRTKRTMLHLAHSHKVTKMRPAMCVCVRVWSWSSFCVHKFGIVLFLSKRDRHSGQRFTNRIYSECSVKTAFNHEIHGTHTRGSHTHIYVFYSLFSSGSASNCQRQRISLSAR